MNEKKALAKNTFIIFLSKIFTQFISFLLLPFYTCYLSNSSYGTIDLINTYISLLVPVLTIQLEAALFRFLIEKRGNVDEEKKIISTVFNIIVRLTIAFIIIGIVLTRFIKINFISLIMINIIVVIFSNLLLQTARGIGNTKKYASASCFIGVTTIILNVILIAIFKLDVKAILISNIISNILGFIYLFISLDMKEYIDFKLVDNNLAKELFKYSSPLVLNGVSWWIFNVSDRTIISLIIGTASNGIYAVSNKFSTLLISLYGVFDLAWAESTSKTINNANREEYYSDVINMVSKLFSSVCLFLIIIMPFIFPVFVNQGYSEAYMYIPILLISAIFSVLSSLHGSIYIALKKTNKIMKTTVIAAGTNIILNLIFIKQFGLYAASISTLISYFAMFILRSRDLNRYLRIRYNSRDILAIVDLFIPVLMAYYLQNILIQIVVGVVIGLILIIFNKNEIISFKNMVMSRFDKR